MTFILSPGTQVVALTEVRGTDGRPIHPRGAVGVIVHSPADYSHKYRVRFLDGFEAAFDRQQLAILSQFKNGEIIDAGIDGSGVLPAEHDLLKYVIYRCIIGSRAYGLDDDESDIDRRGIYLPPAHLHWSLYGVPQQLDLSATEEVYWEAQKFVTLALKANPNILECLYSPLVEHVTPLANELLEIRDRFLSKMVYQTYSGYVLSQFKKLQADLRNNGAVKWKHVMHLLRLLQAGVLALQERTIRTDVGPVRERLLAVKRGQVSFEQCDHWRKELHVRFDQAFEQTLLPEKPDYAAANDWLLRARRQMVEER